MASQNSNGSASSSRSRSQQNRVIMCYHNEPAPLKTVRVNGPTFGKRFYGCSKWPSDPCGFFRWADQVDEIGYLQLKVQEFVTEIAELEMRNECVQREFHEMKKRFDKQQEQLEESYMENACIREGLYSTKADKKLLFLVFVSWVIIAGLLMK